jgi:hypothetical protein
MSNVYDGPTDARQSDRIDLPASRFRPRYRALSDSEKARHDRLKDKAEELGKIFDELKPGRYRALAITALEEAVMWAIKELTS